MSDLSFDATSVLPAAPAIPGLRARPFDPASDYESIAELIRGASVEDRIPYLPTADNLRVELESAEGIDPVRDVVVAEVAGSVVAASGLERKVRDDAPTYELWGAVDPVFRRRGIGTWLLTGGVDHARARANVEDPAADVTVRAFAEATEIGHRAILAAGGFAPVRHFFLMRRIGLDELPAAPLPDGIEIRPVRPDQRRAIFAAENEAFRDHWGHHEATEGDYQRTFGMAELDTDLWVVAWDGDEVASVVQTWIWPEENERLGVRRGWLEHISVRRQWRRRGLGRAMTAASLVKLREASLDDAMLGVDSANPTGALGLYEGLGFTVHSRAAAYQRPLDR